MIALKDAVFGAISGYANANSWNGVQRIGAEAFAGGTTAKMQGGSFDERFKYAGLGAAASVAYKYIVGYEADPRPGGDAEDKKSELAPPVKGANNVGRVSPKATTNPCMACEGSLVSKIGNLIPGVTQQSPIKTIHSKLRRSMIETAVCRTSYRLVSNATGGLHDTIQNYILKNAGDLLSK